MKLVKATSESARRRLKVKELGRIAEEGEVFEVTEERFKVLTGNNRFHSQFVVEIPKTESDELLKRETVEIPTPVIEEEPEIFVIEPGKEAVRVDENLQPIVDEEVTKVEKRKRGRKKKTGEEK